MLIRMGRSAWGPAACQLDEFWVGAGIVGGAGNDAARGFMPIGAGGSPE